MVRSCKHYFHRHYLVAVAFAFAIDFFRFAIYSDGIQKLIDWKDTEDDQWF
jgi:hypothetical protein